MNETGPSSSVTDSEILYRSVRLCDGGYKIVNGVIQISSTAFNDRYMQPSVDRASLKNNNPKSSQKSPTDCVISLIARDIRNEKVERGDALYILDVVSKPEVENPAHAIIVPSPNYKNEKAFRKVKESLARMSTLILNPQEI